MKCLKKKSNNLIKRKNYMSFCLQEDTDENNKKITHTAATKTTTTNAIKKIIE